MPERLRIGFLINSLAAGYEQSLIAGAAGFCGENGLDLIVFTGQLFGWPYDFGYQNTAIYEHIAKANVDALVVATGTQISFIGLEGFASWVARFAGLPLVSLAIPLPGAPTVLMDNAAGLSELLAHLADVHGCRRFAVLAGPAGHGEAELRLATVKDFLAERGLELPDSRVVRTDFTIPGGRAAAERLAAAGGHCCDAIIACNDNAAVGALQVLAERGIRVPEDCRIVGFDDIPRAACADPPLTTVRQDLVGQAAEAFRLARELALGRPVPAETVQTSRLVVRASCGCPASAAADQAAAGRERFRLEDEIHQLRGFLAHLVSAASVDELMDNLRERLESFGIASCAVAVFNRELRVGRGDRFDLPEAADLILSYDETTPRGRHFAPQRFDPRAGLVPPGSFSDRPRTLVANSLYHREVQLGYIVYELGPMTGAIYETLCVQLSAAIRSALVFSGKQKVEERLRGVLAELETYNQKLSDLSQTDDLTGLYNRRGFISLSRRSMDLAVARGKRGLVVFGDMDGLKDINDQYGHEAGDRALKAMGKLLHKTFRSMDIVARLGGDEFAVLAIDITPAFFVSLRERLDRYLAEYHLRSGEPFTLSISLGIAEFGGETDCRLETLLSKADAVQYEEKRQKKTRSGAGPAAG
jgi:diguanylate cyclase (GGDEF)-like protein